MYKVFLKANENLRTEVFKCDDFRDLEMWFTNKANWQKYQVNTPEGIKEATAMGFNPF